MKGGLEEQARQKDGEEQLLREVRRTQDVRGSEQEPGQHQADRVGNEQLADEERDHGRDREQRDDDDVDVLHSSCRCHRRDGLLPRARKRRASYAFGQP